MNIMATVCSINFPSYPSKGPVTIYLSNCTAKRTPQNWEDNETRGPNGNRGLEAPTSLLGGACES